MSEEHIAPDVAGAINYLSEQVARLTAENERLAADRERLDWLDTLTQGQVSHHGNWVEVIDFSEPAIALWKRGGGKSVREAIDAARANGGGQ